MSLEFDAAVSQLVRLGFQRDRAEAQVRAQLAIPAPDHEPDADALEKDEQTEVVKLFRGFGCKVRNLSQARATKQAPGLPDLWVMHRERPIAFWWETKRQVGGRHSEAQLEFREDCARCGVGYGTGDRHAAAEHLIALGLAYLDRGCIEPVRRA